MDADDIPTTITRAVYKHPTAKINQNVFADLIAIAWDDIVKLVHERDRQVEEEGIPPRQCYDAYLDWRCQRPANHAGRHFDSANGREMTWTSGGDAQLN